MMSSFGLGRNIPVICEAEKHCGSSPRMRGKPHRCDLDLRQRRIIPAHAGQTADSWHEYAQGSDLPRACGANYKPQLADFRASGSSPRMRGKPEHADRRLRHRRIIPAHAGQTTCSSPSSTSAPDHPRACGANLAASSEARCANGSSPRMRGKPPPFRPSFLQ